MKLFQRKIKNKNWKNKNNKLALKQIHIQNNINKLQQNSNQNLNNK